VKHHPDVSVIVVVYNIPREAPRTLRSLSADYQRHIDGDDYEVIVVDNGSDPPLDPQCIAGLAGDFRLVRIDQASPSPAAAVNQGIALARGDVIGVMIDGARLVTPGLLDFARRGARLHDEAVVATLGWYLGPGFQRESMLRGYDQANEDALLAAIEWPKDGYRLFEIAALDESSEDGWLRPITESNALFLRRELWQRLEGFDERFDAPGGGLVNLDTWRRAVELPDVQVVLLLGEATFHQLHGGVATNSPPRRQRDNLARWSSQYERLRGRPYQASRPRETPICLGTLPQPAFARLVRAAVDAHEAGGVDSSNRWGTRMVTAARRRLVRSARAMRERASHRQHPPRPPTLVYPWQPPQGPPDHRRADDHLARAEAHHRLGEVQAAALNYRAALTFNPDLLPAHHGLARLRMPGDDYKVWLERLYRALAPATVIEIGVYLGASLRVLRPPTVAIGIDPAPNLVVPLTAETHIFAGTSDEFFAQRRHETLLGGRPLSIGFIDGLHLFEHALRDFVHLEACCGHRSVILLHDTDPMDDTTQSRIRTTQFHTGDVWKTVLCLKHYRPDLDLFTIATPPSGLTVVTRLDPTSRVLADKYEEAVARFIDTPFSAVESSLDDVLDMVPNDWRLVRARLKPLLSDSAEAQR